jgi:hypothetical protein
MWISNLRSTSELTLGVAISVVAVSPSQAADDYALGECIVVGGQYVTEGQGIRPISNAASYLVMHLGGDPDKNLDRVGGTFEGGEITLVKAPRHGKLVLSSDEQEASRGWYRYFPEEGFYGQDRFVMQVEKNGVKVTIHYVMEIITDEESPRGVCELGDWKISLLPFQETDDLVSWLRSTSLSALLTGATDAFSGFADSSGAALVQTTID